MSAAEDAYRLVGKQVRLVSRTGFGDGVEGTLVGYCSDPSVTIRTAADGDFHCSTSILEAIEEAPRLGVTDSMVDAAFNVMFADGDILDGDRERTRDALAAAMRARPAPEDA